MTKFIVPLLATAAASLAGCTTAPVATAASTGVCGTYGYVDVNQDGFISGDEWRTFGTKTYGFWDANHDGRISRSEFENCYRAGGFYSAGYYNPNYWTNYWTAFDVNGDGYLSADEYWSPSVYAKIDTDNSGRIDGNEWTVMHH